MQKQIIESDCRVRTCEGIALTSKPDYAYFEEFKLMKFIGEGAFGEVILTQRKADKQYYALKLMRINQVGASANEINHTLTERRILELVRSNASFVQMVYAFRTDAYLAIVSHYAVNHDLYERMFEIVTVNENEACFYAAELTLALEFLHANKIIYRDLKLANILLDNEGHVRLTDFGVSRMFSETELMYEGGENAFTFCGTVEYMAPEIILGKGYSYAVDWWSLGVITYEIIFGDSLFAIESDVSEEIVMNRITHGKIEYPCKLMSPITVRFLKALLTRNPKRRLGSMNGAADLKEHSFFNNIDWEAVEKRKAPVPCSRLKRLSIKDVLDGCKVKSGDKTKLSKIVKNIHTYREDIRDVSVSLNDPFKDWNFEFNSKNKSPILEKDMDRIEFRDDGYNSFFKKYEILAEHGCFHYTDDFYSCPCKELVNEELFVVRIYKYPLCSNEIYNWRMCQYACSTLIPSIHHICKHLNTLYTIHEENVEGLLITNFAKCSRVTEASIQRIMETLIGGVYGLHRRRITLGSISAKSIYARMDEKRTRVLPESIKIFSFKNARLHERTMEDSDDCQYKQSAALDQRRLGLLMFTLVFGTVVKLTKNKKVCLQAMKATNDWSRVCESTRSLIVKLVTANQSNFKNLCQLTKEWMSAEVDNKRALRSPELLRLAGCMETCNIMDATAGLLDDQTNDLQPICDSVDCLANLEVEQKSVSRASKRHRRTKQKVVEAKREKMSDLRQPQKRSNTMENRTKAKKCCFRVK